MSDEPKPSERPPVSDRRSSDRIEVTWSVDCESRDTFLYASIANISEFGIFVRTQEPLEVGTRLILRFAENLREQMAAVGQAVHRVNGLKEPVGRVFGPIALRDHFFASLNLNAFSAWSYMRSM